MRGSDAGALLFPRETNPALFVGRQPARTGPDDVKRIISASAPPRRISGACPAAEKPGAPDAPRRAEGFPPIKSLTKPMDLEELYGILVIDRSVERVLTAISPIAKEG